MAWRPGQSYAQDLRDRVFAHADAGRRVGAIAAALQVGISYVSKALSRRKATGETAARPQCGHVPRKLAGHLEAIRAHVAARPDETLLELKAWLLEAHDVSASRTLLCRTLRDLGLTHKKRLSMQPNRTGPMSRSPARHGKPRSRTSIPREPSSSTRPG